MSLIALRPLITLDVLPKTHVSVISFHHPGYPSEDLDDVLLKLKGFDVPGGLHHRTAWLACAIVAGNAWHGYLTESRQSSPRLTVTMDGVLTGTDYWFHVPNQPFPTTEAPSSLSPPPSLAPYPVVPSFQDWRFPHGNLPSGWVHRVPKEPNVPQAPSNFTATVKSRDQYCRITQCRDCTDAAHVCPKSEHVWFNNNKMRLYNTNQRLNDTVVTNDECNAFLLRRDLHADFDSGKFVIIPKGEEGDWVVHLMEVTYELGKLYHNVPTHDISSVAVEFLLARFAWAIFPWLRVFLTTGKKRWLICCRVDDDAQVKWVTEHVSGDDCRRYAERQGGSRSRSQSPKKRVREGDFDGDFRDEDDTRYSADVSDAFLATTDEHIRKRARHELSTTPPTPPSPDSDAEYAEDVTLLQEILPTIATDPSKEVTYSTDRHWQNITIYPGWRRVERLKERLLEEQRRAAAETMVVEVGCGREVGKEV